MDGKIGMIVILMVMWCISYILIIKTTSLFCLIARDNWSTLLCRWQNAYGSFLLSIYLSTSRTKHILITFPLSKHSANDNTQKSSVFLFISCKWTTNYFLIKQLPIITSINEFFFSWEELCRSKETGPTRNSLNRHDTVVLFLRNLIEPLDCSFGNMFDVLLYTKCIILGNTF